MRRKKKQIAPPPRPASSKPLAVRLAEIWVLVCLYGSLLVPLLVAQVTIFPFVYPKALFFQAVVDLAFPAWLALALRDRRYRPRSSLLLWGMLAWVLAMGLATSFADNPLFSLFSYPERMTGLWTQVHLLGWFVMAIGMVKTTERRNQLVTVQLAVAFIVACSAIAQSLFPTFKILGTPFGVGQRLSGTLGNPIYLGGYEAFSVFFALLLFRGVRGVRRGLLLLCVMAAIWALYLSGSRGPMIGLCAGLVAFLIVLGIVGGHRRLVVSGAIGLLVVAAIYGVFAGFVASRPSMEPFWASHKNLRHFFDFSGSTRFPLWMAAWDGFLSKPLLGWGLGGYEQALDSVWRPSFHFSGREDKAHNIPLGVLCETGVMGALAYLALWAGFCITAVRAARKGAFSWPQGAALLGAGAGYFVHGLFAPDSLSTDLAIAVAFAAVASSMSATEQVVAESTSATMDSRRLVALGLASVAALVVLWFGSVSPFLASSLMKKSNDGASRVSGALTVARIENAQRFWTPYLDDQLVMLLGMAQASTQSPGAPTWAQREILATMVLKTADRYWRFNPSHARYRTQIADGFVNIARANNRPDIERLAEAMYRKDIAESPNRQMYRLSYGKYLAQAGRLDEAEEQYRKALAGAPGMGEVMWLLGRFLWGDRHRDDEGSKLMIQATERAGDERYKPAAPLEWLQLTQALARQQARDKLRAMVDVLPQVAPNDMSTAKIYVEIAKLMEDLALLRERDRVLQIGIQRNPQLATAVASVLNGSARLRDNTTSIP